MVPQTTTLTSFPIVIPPHLKHRPDDSDALDWPVTCQELRRSLRLFYAVAPGDAMGTFKRWRDGCEDPTIMSVAYSAQFYSVCRDLNAQAFVISSHPRKALLRDALLRLRNDTEYYEQKRRACASVQDRFFDDTQSWGAVLKEIVTAVRNDCEPRGVSNGSAHGGVASGGPIDAAPGNCAVSANHTSAQEHRKPRN